MTKIIEAIYENGVFRPLQPETVAFQEGQIVRLKIAAETEPESLQLAARVYEGLSKEEINDIERIALDRGNSFDSRALQ